jgi:hypothetical protein
MHKKLTPTFKLIQNALDIYSNRQVFPIYLGIGIYSTIFGLFILWVLDAAGAATQQFLKPQTFSPLIGLLIFGGWLICLIILGFIWCFFNAVVIVFNSKVVRKSRITFKIIFTESYKQIFRLISGFILRSFIILLGFILLIIPSIIFSVWLTFVPYVAVLEKNNNVIKSSKQLVAGKFWPVLWRIIVFGILIIIPTIVFQNLHPYVGLVWTAVAGPFAGLLYTLLYFELVSIKTEK